MKSNRKEIRETIYIDIDLITILTGTIQEIAKNILDIENRLKKECSLIIKNPELYKRFELSYQYGYGQDESDSVLIYGVRDETEEEYNIRIEKNKKAQEAQKKAKQNRTANTIKNELKILAHLQKKYKNIKQ